MPTILPPSSTTTSAPIRLLRMRREASSTVVSGPVVSTARPLVSRMDLIVIARASFRARNGSRRRSHRPVKPFVAHQ